MMKSAEIRQSFLDFFKTKQHHIVPSAPIVVKNDPTLLFTNAGMNQFKDYFLGNKKPIHPRVADTQKCLRVSGKHNDLEEVGVDTYHHTMFEMLGNWSFGDYFKKEAIEWSWELLTMVYHIPKENLYVTIFEGDEKEGLPRDEEAYNEWLKYLPADRVLLGNKKDNFWEMGDTGPCGPCSEIHVDCRVGEEKKITPGASLVNADHPQVIEIWNIVFIQFNRKKDGHLELLPAKHVDTGMGFERLVRVLQQKQSNYDTDIFSGTIEATEKIIRKKYDTANERSRIAFRVLADHIRAISFTIADGQLPSNTGAGYVIRRILRRAVRYYYATLEYKHPLLHQLVPVIAQQFEQVFPELKKQEEFVQRVVREEEESFLRTLDKGLKKIDELLLTSKNNIIPGASAFELYDTYGFPIDLTRLIASENGFTVDEPEFEKEMQQQKNRSRSASVIDTDDWVVLSDQKSNGFAGYDCFELTTKLLKYRRAKGKGKESYQLVLESTPFYAESGGQVGDTGSIASNDTSVRIFDTKKENDLIIHFTEDDPSALSEQVRAQIDINRRKEITMHHSVTHLLHAALRKVLGNHVAQKGSLVNEEHTRFDFSHFAKLTDEEILAVEEMVNQKIRENVPVVIRTMPKAEAIAMGAMALFGEKYGDQVRVVIMDPEYSIELCGGCHVGYTGNLGIFKIKQETAVAAGIRRIEGVSGKAAEQFIASEMKELYQVKDALKNPKDLMKVITALQQDNASLSKKIESLEARQLVALRNELLHKDQIINNISFIGEIVEVPGADALKKLCYDLKNNLHDHVVVFCANIGGKAAVAIGISETVVKARGLDAGKIIKEHISPLIKGGGGGQPVLATAGGHDHSRFAEVIETVKNLI